MYVVGQAKGWPSDAVIITAFLGVPAALAGLGFFKYLQASEKDDAKTDNTLPIGDTGNSDINISIDNGPQGEQKT